ncbi:MAG: nicotinate (nicotinamide) nucleotide adenylyltransferase [Oscillospiraceae bacterium]|nr:nicotinate (nicotinamide) nucleotide adenylyltransferase [Oscillospiraceae bacterium]
MKIAIYGGTFNPPHRGHVESLQAVYEQAKPDRVLVIPASIPPHKELAAGSPDAEKRLELTRLAFKELPYAEVTDMELTRTGKSYTSDTVAELLRKYPDAELMLAMGTDMFLSFETWHEYRYLIDNVTMLVFARREGEDEKIFKYGEYLESKYGAKINYIMHDPLPISSSEIRRLLPRRLGRELLPGAVFARIVKNGDYAAKPDFPWLREQSYAYLSPKRIPHVQGCEWEAVRLAKRWGESEEDAAEAGILHDITKKLVLSEQLILSEKYGIINDTYETANVKLLHAKTGAALARDLFNISDRVYSAIRWHTTGKPDMTLLEKIIYMADYIEPNRDFPGVDKLRKLAYEDLDAAMVLGLKMSLEDIRSYGAEPYEVTVSAYEWYKAKLTEKGK